MSEPTVEALELPYGSIVGDGATVHADGSDINPHPDVDAFDNVRVIFTPSDGNGRRVNTVIWTGVDGPTILHPQIETGRFVDGRLVLDVPTPPQPDGMRLMATVSDDMVPNSWGWKIEWTGWPSGKGPGQVIFPLAPGSTIDLGEALAGYLPEVPAVDFANLLAAADEVLTARDQTIALRDEVQVISGLTGEDEAVATLVGDPGSATSGATRNLAAATASGVIAEHRNAVAPGRASLPGMFTLLGGTPDENMIVATPSSQSDTSTRAAMPDGSSVWRLYKHGAGTAWYSWTPAEPIDVPPSQGFLLDIDVSDATMIPAGKYILLRIYTDAAFSEAGVINFPVDNAAPNTFHGIKWSGGPLKTGRNLIRVAADYPYTVPPTWGSKVHRVELRISPTNSVTVDVHGLYLEAPKKARAIVVADRGYKSFYTYAYPKLRAAGIPVTWAVDPGLFGTGPGENVAMTEAEIHAAMASGNGDSCSFHAWQGQVTSTMTAEQLVDDTARCIKWLQRHGYEGRMWRAAFTQNDAPQWAAIEHMVLGARNGDNRLGVARQIGEWPPIGWMNMTFMQTDNVTLEVPGALDARFDLVKRTHGMFVPFFHAVGNTVFNITPARFDAWLAKSIQGIEEGWLEFGTFESFFAQIGGSFSAVGGGTVATWAEPDGTVATKRLA